MSISLCVLFEHCDEFAILMIFISCLISLQWFKPAGLTTKHGLQGNIVESVGVHGVMKCLFNKPIKQHDTVCLPLFKRIYPKFAPVNVNTGATDGTVAEEHDLLIL